MKCCRFCWYFIAVIVVVVAAVAAVVDVAFIIFSHEIQANHRDFYVSIPRTTPRERWRLYCFPPLILDGVIAASMMSHAKSEGVMVTFMK